MKRILIFLLFFDCLTGLAQGIRSPLITRYTGIGTYSSTFTDVFSFASNQAALSKVKSIMSGIYAERRFMLKELDRYAAAIAIPFRHGGVGISALHTGSSHYRESQLGLAYGRALGESVSLGVQFNYHLISIAGYGNSGAMHAEIGSIIHLTDNLHAGVHVYNLLNSKLKNEMSRKLPAIYTLGLGYELSESIYMSAEVAKEEGQPVNMNIAVHYSLVKQLFLRGGIATGSNQFFFGTGMKWKNARMDVVGTYHPQLGVTPSLLLIFSKPGEKE